jgi:hypothetical protein
VPVDLVSTSLFAPNVIFLVVGVLRACIVVELLLI